MTIWVCDLCDEVFQGRDNQASMTCHCGGHCQELEYDPESYFASIMRGPLTERKEPNA